MLIDLKSKFLQKKNIKSMEKFPDKVVKGELNLNFLNLTINREKFWLLKRFGPIS